MTQLVLLAMEEHQWIIVPAVILLIVTVPVLYLVILDVETQKRIIRRYIKQLNETGGIANSVTWEHMRNAFFVMPAWLFRIPDRNSRPDIYAYPQITGPIDKVRKNWQIIRVLLPIVLLLLFIVFWGIDRSA